MNKNSFKIAVISNDTDNVSELIIKIKNILINNPLRYDIIDLDFKILSNLESEENEIIEVYKEFPYLDKIKCKFCGKCIEYCKNNAIIFQREIPSVFINKKLCKSCFICEKQCNISAIKRKNFQIGFILKSKISKNIAYYQGFLKNKNIHHNSLLNNYLNNSKSTKIALIDSFNQELINKVMNLSEIIIYHQFKNKSNSIDNISYFNDNNTDKILFTNDNNFIHIFKDNIQNSCK